MEEIKKTIYNILEDEQSYTLDELNEITKQPKEDIEKGLLGLIGENKIHTSEFKHRVPKEYIEVSYRINLPPGRMFYHADLRGIRRREPTLLLEAKELRKALESMIKDSKHISPELLRKPFDI